MLPAAFLQVWRGWLKKPAPTKNFRNGRATASTYQLEHDIDHSVTYIRGLVRRFIDGEPLDYGRLATKELGEIERWLGELNRLQLNEKEKQRFLAYLVDMKTILDQLTK